MSDKRIINDAKDSGTKRNTNARPRTSPDSRIDDVLDNDLDATVNEGNQRAARGWHTEEKPLSKRATKGKVPARPSGGGLRRS